MAGFFRLRFLFSSFGPLFAIFAIKLYYDAGVPKAFTWLFGGLFFLSILVFLEIRGRFQGSNETWVALTELKSKDAEVFSYLTTYIPPLIARDMSKVEVYLPLIILYAILVAAYMRLSSPYLNPYFILSGVRVYEGKVASSRSTVTILSKGPLDGIETLGLHEIGNGDLFYYHGGMRAIQDDGEDSDRR